MHADFRPLDLSTWVDDLRQADIGRDADVVSRAKAMATALATRLNKAGFNVSGKSALVTYPHCLAREISHALAAAGVPLKCPRQ
eukprot:3534733-Pyramimonas_sp.AAC.1